MEHMADAGTHGPVLSARAAGLVGCTTCGKVSALGTVDCPRCGAALHVRKPASLQRVWAWLIVGMMAYIPANVLPIMITTNLGRQLDSTIVGGVIDLAHHGAWDLAFIVGFASIVIPVSKFLVIGYLAYSLQFRVALPIHTRVHLYEIVEFVGRWSMIDVFVVAILAALVRLGILASVDPGPAAVFFALSVAFTMLSAQAMDARLIWDTAERDAAPHD